MEAQEKNALHLATHSGWYRFERRGENWEQTDRALTYWQMSCIQVDPDNSKRVYIGTEHSGMFVTDDGGKDWTRANPNVPCLTMSSMLAVSGKLLVGTMPAALYFTAEGGGWQELKGVRQGAAVARSRPTRICPRALECSPKRTPRVAVSLPASKLRGFWPAMMTVRAGKP